MSTKAKAKKTKIDRSSLPPGTESPLTARDICLSLSIGSRKFAEMLASGKYPRPDFKIGTLNRWYQETHNQWLRDQKAKDQPAKE